MYSANQAILNGNKRNTFELFQPDQLDQMPVFGTQGIIPMDTSMAYNMPELSTPNAQGVPGGGNVSQQLAAGSWGGVPNMEPDPVQGALGGAASGASIGGAVGGPWGAVIGAVGGAILSLF